MSKKNIIANKHNASGTSINQPMDRCKVFTTEKRLNKSTTLQHVPVKFHLLKRAILTELSKE